jgi:hypothetical protein
LLWNSKSMFRPGLPLNGKRDCSVPNFVHVTACIYIIFIIRAIILFTTRQ